jgi:hypothetical protein
MSGKFKFLTAVTIFTQVKVLYWDLFWEPDAAGQIRLEFNASYSG